MARPAADRVRVLWTGTGTGTMSLGAALANFQSFPAALNGLTVSYGIEHQSTTEAEAGYGVYTSAGNTLSRVYRTYPTLGGAAVNFSSGDKHVFLTMTQGDAAPHFATTNPTVNDDRNAGYLNGYKWINTTTHTLFFLVDDTVGAASWAQVGSGTTFTINQYEVVARIAAGSGSASGLDTVDLTSGTPASGDFLLGWESTGELRKFDVGALPAASGDLAPTLVTSGASPFSLTDARRASSNVTITTHAASVDFEVPQAATAGSGWVIQPVHDSAIVSVVSNTGSVNGTAGGSARLVNGGWAYVWVKSNGAGDAPVVLVIGSVVVAAASVAGIKTYDNDDHGQDFDLTAGAGTQTMPAVASLITGWYVNIFNHSGGSITIDGADADVTLVNIGVLTIRKHQSGALIAIGSTGSGAPIVLDAA
jgi:hypothetical protein